MVADTRLSITVSKIANDKTSAHINDGLGTLLSSILPCSRGELRHRVSLIVFNSTTHKSIHILPNKSRFSADFWLFLIPEADQEFSPLLPSLFQPCPTHRYFHQTSSDARDAQMGKSFPPSLWSFLRKHCLVPPPLPPCSGQHPISSAAFHINLCPEKTLLISFTPDAFSH